MRRNRILKLALLAGSALALNACLAQSQIQAKYMTREEECRSEAQDKTYEAERQFNATKGTAPDPQPAPGQAVAATANFDQAYVIGAAFSECMNKTGWKVTVPKPPGTPGPIATGPTTPPPSGAPGPGGVVALKANPALQPSAVQPQPGYLQPAPAVARVAPPQPVAEPVPAAPILGPGVQPSPAAVFKEPAPVSAPAPMQGQPSTYAPARSQGQYAPTYGTGVGRNF